MMNKTQTGASHLTEKKIGFKKIDAFVPFISSDSKMVFSIFQPTNNVVKSPEIGIIQLDVT
jgi:hypothetical protein